MVKSNNWLWSTLVESCFVFLNVIPNRCMYVNKNIFAHFIFLVGGGGGGGNGWGWGLLICCNYN